MSMKTRLFITTALAPLVVVSLAASQAGQFQGWYVGIEAGVSWVDDTDFSVRQPDFVPVEALVLSDSALLGRADFDTGFAAFATLGHAWNNWRVEFELGYRQNDFDPFFGNKMIAYPTTRALIAEPYPWFEGKNRSGDLTEFSQMINVIYDWQFADRWSLSLGAGIGGDLVDVEAHAGPFHVDDDDYVFAWQLIAGLNYAITPRSALFVNYRFFNADSPDFDVRSDSISWDEAAFVRADDLQKHSVTIGWRYDLYADEGPVAAPPPPPPPEPAPPPPAAVPSTFTVFFANNKANLTAEALAAIRDATAQARQTGSATLRIEGGGSGMTGRRVAAIRRALVAEGIPNSAISASGDTIDVRMNPAP